MEWNEIDINNLPSGEVLAANFSEGKYGYKEKLIGYLAPSDGRVICADDYQILDHCTHYIDIHSFDL